MRLPSPVDYSDAVGDPQRAFTDVGLARSTAAAGLMGPIAASGGFALTFDMKGPGGRFAVRCFHKHAEHLQDRYAAIGSFIGTHRPPYLANVEYQEEGVRVEGSLYPVVKMQWVEGQRLDTWLEENRRDATGIDVLRRSLALAVAGLRSLGAAHGDLQHGNILVSPDGLVTLVDYDGMYLPSLAHLGASEYGHRNYQHPQRLNRYDSSLDVFPGFLLDLSLKALQYRPDLYEKYSEGENIVLGARDFAAPARSRALAELAQIAELGPDMDVLLQALGSDYPTVVTLLSGGRTQAAASTPGGIRTVELIGAAAISATDSAALLAREGGEVTVIGKITSLYTAEDKRGRPYSFLTCGNRTFTIVCWAPVHAELTAKIAVEGLKGRWVRLTGTLELFRGRPQIQLRSVRQLHLETPERAENLLRQAAVRPAPPRPAAPRPPFRSVGPPGARASNPSTAFSGPIGLRGDFADDFEAYMKLRQPQPPAAATPPPSATKVSTSQATSPVAPGQPAPMQPTTPPPPLIWPPIAPPLLRPPAAEAADPQLGQNHQGRRWLGVLAIVVALVALAVLYRFGALR